MNVKCPKCSAEPQSIVKFGSFLRKSDSKTVQRYKCKKCGAHFSKATFSKSYRQNKRRLNFKIFMEFCSGVSQRRMAVKLFTNRKTVARKLKIIAIQLRAFQDEWLKEQLFIEVQFDDLETIEHSKLKPVTVPMVVSQNRKILGFEVARIPAKGHLSRRAKKKYGVRENQAPQARKRLLAKLTQAIHPYALFECDEHPAYPELIKSYFPQSTCHRFRSQRAASTGQGELKKGRYDPLFKVNHTFAMFRYSMSRLIRRSWCTTKSLQALEDHLTLYMVYHNMVQTHETLPAKTAARRLFAALTS